MLINCQLYLCLLPRFEEVFDFGSICSKASILLLKLPRLGGANSTHESENVFFVKFFLLFFPKLPTAEPKRVQIVQNANRETLLKIKLT